MTAVCESDRWCWYLGAKNRYRIISCVRWMAQQWQHELCCARCWGSNWSRMGHSISFDLSTACMTHNAASYLVSLIDPARLVLVLHKLLIIHGETYLDLYNWVWLMLTRLAIPTFLASLYDMIWNVTTPPNIWVPYNENPEKLISKGSMLSYL